MATRKQLIAGTAGIAVVGILSYLGYKVFKELNTLDLDDIIWENIDDAYYYRRPKSSQGSESHDERTEPFI